MTKILSIIFVMIFTKNYVLVQFLGICPFLGVSKKFDSAVGMSGAVVFVMTLASAATWLIYTYVMVPNHLEYLSTIIFILVIAALVQFVEIFLKRYMPPLYQALGVYLPLITTNCIVLAATELHVPGVLRERLCRRRGLRAGADPVLRRPQGAGERQAPQML